MTRSNAWIVLAASVIAAGASVAVNIATGPQSSLLTWLSVAVLAVSATLVAISARTRVTNKTRSSAGQVAGLVPISLLAISLATGTVLVVRGGSSPWLPNASTVDPAVSLWHLAVLALVAGALSCAALEFIKKLSPLATRFNRRAVLSTFGEEVEAAKFHSGSHFSELAGFSGKISYAGNLRQVAAQVSQSLREECRVSLRESPGDNDSLRRFMTNLGPYWPLLSPRVTEEMSYEEILQLADEYIERRVDAFQIEATARWYSSLRATAALIACVLSGAGAWAGGASASAITITLALGLVIGGPVSWTVRDLVRIIERGVRR